MRAGRLVEIPLPILHSRRRTRSEGKGGRGASLCLPRPQTENEYQRRTEADSTFGVNDGVSLFAAVSTARLPSGTHRLQSFGRGLRS